MSWVSKGRLFEISLFSGLGDDDLEALAKVCLIKSFKPKEVIFSEGEDGHGFFVVLTGLVEVFKLSTEGKKQILHILGPGEPFGEVAVFEGRKFPAHALSLKKSEALYFPRDAFLRLVGQRPEIALRMLAVMARRLKEMVALVENLSLKEVTARLASFLFYAYQRMGEKALHLGFSKAQLAGLLGTVPETLSRALKRLSEEGLISVEARRILIKDPLGLLKRGMGDLEVLP